MRTSALFLLLFLAGTLLPADMLLSRADQRRKAGDAETASRLYEGWLRLNPGAPGSARVFESYFSVEQDFPTLLSESARFLSTAKGIDSAGQQFLRIARMYDLAGRIEAARNAYLSAADEGAPATAIVSAFLLSLEMNDTEAMGASLSRLSGKGGSADLLLGALASLKAGDTKSARTTLLGLAGQTGDSDLALRALWVLYATALSKGDVPDQAAMRSRLTTRFPSAPETALAAGQAAQVVLSPGPDALAAVETPQSTTTSQPDQVTTQTTAPQTLKPTFSVQAGSFQMKENSDDLVAELAKRGFNPVVIEDTVAGKPRYRVLAGLKMKNDQAKAVLQKLSQAGFSGFLVADK